MLRLITGAGLGPTATSHYAQAATVATTTAATGARNPDFIRFALIGDTPYSDGDEDRVREVMKSAASEASFTIHVGDLKSGRESCANELLTRRANLLHESPVPMVIVPGDNEWTDCSRASNGGFDPVERLGFLRRLLAGNSSAAAKQRLSIEHPSSGRPSSGFPDPKKHPEYVRWQAGPCLFVVLNIPGSHNGLTPYIATRFNRERATRNKRWLLDSAREARERGLAGLVVCLHADIEFERARLDDGGIDVLDPDHPYAWIRGLLMRVAARFPGTVIVLNGDRHRFINDNPFSEIANQPLKRNPWGIPARIARSRLSRLMRVQSFGWPFSSHHIIIEASRVTQTTRADPLLQITVGSRILGGKTER